MQFEGVGLIELMQVAEREWVKRHRNFNSRDEEMITIPPLLRLYYDFEAKTLHAYYRTVKDTGGGMMVLSGWARSTKRAGQEWIDEEPVDEPDGSVLLNLKPLRDLGFVFKQKR